MSDEAPVKVWDIVVRVFHWSLVLFFTVAYLTGEEETQLHSWSGYVVLGLISFRIIWGVIGTRYARFWNFIYSPAHTFAYARSLFSGQVKHYLGHNPLGGWMIITLLLFIGFTSWTGLEVEAVDGKGPLALEFNLIQPAYAHDSHEHEDKEGGEFWGELHEFFADATVFLVFLHIGGVFFSSRIEGENLARAMVTGYKQPKPD